MAEHPNAELVRAGYAAFDAQDMATLDSLFDDEVVWHTAGRNPLAGDHRGKAELFGRFFAGLGERSGGTFGTRIKTLVADDDHVVAIVEQSGTANGVTLDGSLGVDVYRVRDGKVVEAWVLTFDQYLSDAFLGGGPEG